APVALEVAVRPPGLRRACVRPPADYGGLVGDEAAYRHFENQRGNVFAADGVGLRIGEFLSRRMLIVDEVEGLTEVDHEWVLALSDKQPALSGAARNVDVVNKLPGIGII